MTTAVVMLSGGYDSVAALEMTLRDRRAACIFVDYGQPYRLQEKRAVDIVAEHYADHPHFLGVRILRLDMLTSDVPVPEYVPLRNLVIASAAANVAQSIGACEVVTGSKTDILRPGDPYSFRDSCVQFYRMLEKVVFFATESGMTALRFEMPIAGWDKVQVLKLLTNAGFDLASLWSCYRDSIEPCGTCHHCIELAHAREALHA